MPGSLALLLLPSPPSLLLPFPFFPSPHHLPPPLSTLLPIYPALKKLLQVPSSKKKTPGGWRSEKVSGWFGSCLWLLSVLGLIALCGSGVSSKYWVILSKFLHLSEPPFIQSAKWDNDIYLTEWCEECKYNPGAGNSLRRGTMSYLCLNP